MTPGGRGVAVVLMLVGIGLIGVLTATVASFFVEEGTDREKQYLEERIERIEAILTQLVHPRVNYADVISCGHATCSAEAATW